MDKHKCSNHRRAALAKRRAEIVARAVIEGQASHIQSVDHPTGGRSIIIHSMEVLNNGRD